MPFRFLSVNVQSSSWLLYTSEEIDVRRAKEAKERAKEQLRQEQSIREYHMSKASLARAMSRLRYSSKDDMRI